MYCTKCGAQIPDGSTFCTSCGARVGCAEDQAEPVAFPVGDSALAGDPAAPAPSSAPAGRQAAQGAPAHMAAQPQYEQPFSETAESIDLTPQPKKPKHRGRIVAAVIGGVAVVAIVAAIVVVPRIGASSEVTSGGKGYVVCACETKILPKNSKGKKLKSYTVELTPANGKGKGYTIKVDGEDGFAMEDFGELPDQKYQMTITSGKGKKKSTTTMKVDYAKGGSDAPKNVELTQSKKEAKASAKAAVKTANELFTDKILEYQKKYGEGEAVDMGNSLYGTQGVGYAELIDFDGDGQDELLIEYSDEPVDYGDKAAAAHLEVWAYKDGEIKKVYSPEVNVFTQQVGVSIRLAEYEGKTGFIQWLDHGTAIKQNDVSGESGPSAHEYQVKLIGYDGQSFDAMSDLIALSEFDFSTVDDYGFLYASEDWVNSTIGTVATTLEQLKSKDSDDTQASYEAVSATQDVSFTAPVGEGAPDPDVTCQISATWTYPQVKGQGVGVAKFNKDMIQLVADALDASKQATPHDENCRVTTMYYAEIVSIDGDIACVRTYTDSYQPPYRSEQVTRSAYYNLKTGEKVSLEDSLAQHGLSFDTLKSEAKQAIKAAKTNMYSSYTNSYEDDDNFTEDHFYYDGKGYVVVLDTGVFDCNAWGTHDLVAHAFDSSYSSGQDVTPEYPRYTYILNE
ncbi:MULTISPECIES: zinc ribbon domain-containing protein [unclassified Collinsella]|uniref:zinc ribbon domain-containing protein n=1 Tax=unclassified Collinsella TaxID=2637548 RepID=UPI000E526476|nr:MULTISPECIES: zinc ribbon domain-containing protein [unclassified Collinsella]RGT48040.1 zinc ribbon domain-containing protein [Collinsella sp. AF18-8LB]RGT52510.1 zinc ribbon domain-containing protein [Collinsella sp. AF18-8]RGT67344.1 zinc ribbon domain-containing protein [Collinsella sp. AF18-33LB]